MRATRWLAERCAKQPSRISRPLPPADHQTQRKTPVRHDGWRAVGAARHLPARFSLPASARRSSPPGSPKKSVSELFYCLWCNAPQHDPTRRRATEAEEESNENTNMFYRPRADDTMSALGENVSPSASATRRSNKTAHKHPLSSSITKMMAPRAAPGLAVGQ